MSRKTLDDLFLATLGELYDAEAQLAVGLPVLQRASLEGDLETLLTDMHQATCGQMLRLETVFGLLGRRAASEPCWSVAPLVVDAYDAARARDSFSRHTGVGLALLSILHLQIVRLQALCAWATRFDLSELSDLLELPLAEKVVFARRLAAHALGADGRSARDALQPARTLN